jgi:hypothetical protein
MFKGANTFGAVPNLDEACFFVIFERPCLTGVYSTLPGCQSIMPDKQLLKWFSPL